jgi:hypothetical protein
MEIDEKNERWSEENMIDFIRATRNNLIKDFLDERHMKDYVHQQYKISDLSNIKIQSIKKDLMNLLVTPVNVSWYATLIQYIKTNDVAVTSDENRFLFYREIEMILKKYIY